GGPVNVTEADLNLRRLSRDNGADHIKEHTGEKQDVEPGRVPIKGSGKTLPVGRSVTFDASIGQDGARTDHQGAFLPPDYTVTYGLPALQFGQGDRFAGGAERHAVDHDGVFEPNSASTFSTDPRL